MAGIKGINVNAPVVPLDTNDVHPSHEARFGKGGYRTVATTAERDAIPAPRLEAGMLVYVEADGLIYQLASDLATWSQLETGGGQPDAHAATHAADGSDPITVAASQISGGSLPQNAALTFNDGTSDSEVGGWGFGVETNGGNEYATVTATGIVVHGTSASTTINPANVAFGNGTSLAVGTFAFGGGYGGISLNCAVGVELNWQAGHLKATTDAGVTAANILCDSPLEFPGNGTDNVQIDAAGVTFSDGTQQTTAWVGVPVDSVSTSSLQDASVTTAKLSNGAVTSAKLASSVAVQNLTASTLTVESSGSGNVFAVTIPAFGVGDVFVVSGAGAVTKGLWNGTAIGLAYGGTGATTAAGARTALGLGTAATESSSSFAAASHTHTIANVTGLQAALDGKQASGSYAATVHTHGISDVTGLQTALDGKQASGSYAAAVHTHGISDVTGLQTALDGKQVAGSYAASTHTHAASDIASGTIATARLGSGTASSSSWLRGDSSWQSLAASATTDTTNASNITSGTLAAARIGTHASTHNPGGSDAVSLVEIYEFTRSSKPADATGSNGAYTWTPPAGCKAVEMLIIAPGGGGGSGRRGAAGSARYGGGGGAGGNIIQHVMRRSVITTALTVNVGAGGAGGAVVTADDTSGNNGTAAGTSSVLFNGASFTLMAGGGNGGGGGTVSAGTAGTAVAAYAYTSQGSVGGASSVTANGQSGANAQAVGGLRLTGGSAGGGISTGNTAYNGGSYTMAANLALAGMVDFTSNTASGGNASTSAAGGTGADGISYGFGGSGGGASANGNNSGKGGNGGDGYVRITCWY